MQYSGGFLGGEIFFLVYQNYLNKNLPPNFFGYSDR